MGNSNSKISKQADAIFSRAYRTYLDGIAYYRMNHDLYHDLFNPVISIQGESLTTFLMLLGWDIAYHYTFKIKIPFSIVQHIIVDIYFNILFILYILHILEQNLKFILQICIS